ncbi:MAG: MFS transporter permease [Actinobacteria bacterium]|nr:MFS transporter permease [Actinomycetota bacterium]
MARAIGRAEPNAQQFVTVLQRATGGLGKWWYPRFPHRRAVMFRRIVYAFVIVDVLLTSFAVGWHGELPGELYQPLLIGRILPLPVPTPLSLYVIKAALLVASALALTRRMPRLYGIAVFVLYLEWMIVNFSYGKVDHDRFALLIALAALPTVPLGDLHDEDPDEAGGWALRCVQVAVVLTYFLAAYAKLRFGGIEWLNGSTLVRAILRRGTSVADPLIGYPPLLIGAQYLIVAFELASPFLLVKGRMGRALLWAAFAFHAGVYATLRLSFIPHLVCLLAFFPLERVRPPPSITKVGARFRTAAAQKHRTAHRSPDRA